ncbi:MAG: hypothetical protein WC539_11060 [Nitrospirota bacterium]
MHITNSEVHLVEIREQGGVSSVEFAKTVNLPSGIVMQEYASSNIQDLDSFSDILKKNIPNNSAGCRVALSLPDSLFCIQIIDFDEFPAKAGDRERLIRWRLEKSAFDASDTILKYQKLKHPEKKNSILACIAKKAVVFQYETALLKAGLEPWAVGISSLHALSFYFPYLFKTAPIAAIAQVYEDSFTTLVAGPDGARFYRRKEIRRGPEADILAKLTREIDDSLHFYTHANGSQESPINRLYLAGDSAIASRLTEEFKNTTSLTIEVLHPSVVLSSGDMPRPNLASALGAGYAL